MSSGLPDQIVWGGLASINANYPIVALHHFHPGGGQVAKRFSDADMHGPKNDGTGAFDILSQLNASGFDGVYLRGDGEVRRFGDGDNLNGHYCNLNSMSCSPLGN